ncbi:MAG: proline--tRNA ligase [Candidatus Micrarchaeota archaeon]
MALDNKKNENFSEWYLELVQKSELMDYSAVQGCMIFRPASIFIWERIQEFLNEKFSVDGVKNAYFPLFIPESMLSKEAEHFQGFTPEVAWVTRGGNDELGEKLALRPTSETVIYSTYAKWVSSYRDLPLKLNQWCNIIRWDTKTLKPFLRTREFLWQEGHTVHSSEEDAERMVSRALGWYIDVCKELLAIPVFYGVKSKIETFPGAVYTMGIEALMPDGKSLQSGTSHNLGQNFSKMFNLQFKTKDETKEYGWTTSWGVSTRLIGAVAMLHSDDKGLVLPPKIAETQVVIVPIYKTLEDKKMCVIAANRVVSVLKKQGLRLIIDEREDKTPGFKFNDWEMKGVPLRIEIGLMDLAKTGVTIARRDTGEKEFVVENEVSGFVESVLQEIQSNLYSKAKALLDSSVVEVEQLKELKISIEDKKIVKAFCCDSRCEEAVHEESQATSRIVEKASAEGKCIICSKPTADLHWFAKAY